MASSSHVKDIMNELTCAVCLQLFEEPITLTCGHSFCCSCFENYWESKEEDADCVCPNCHEVLPQKPKLKKSVILSALVEQMKKRDVEGSQKVESQAESKDGEGDEVNESRRVKVGGCESHCEVCNEEAAMRCVPCEILCCERHVKPHKQKGHRLVEPGVDVEEPRCTEHENSVHFYCKDDDTLVCLMCTVEKHKDHQVVPVELAHAEFKGILVAKYSPLIESIKQLWSQIEQVQQEVKDTQLSGRGSEERIEEERREIHRAVDEKVNLMKSWLSERQRGKLSHLEHETQNLQKEVDSLCETASTLKASLGELASISFLEGYKDLLHRLESRSHFTTTEPAQYRLLVFSVVQQTADSLIQQFENLLKEIQKELVKQVEAADLQYSFLKSLYGRTPSLDPNSANGQIMISQGLRMATLTGTNNHHPEHPDRFDVCCQVVSSDCFSSGRHYWEVEVSSSSFCRMGICLNSMGRKGRKPALGDNPKSWCLEKDENKYSARHNNQSTDLSVPGNPERFGFFLDCEAGELKCFWDSRVLHVFRWNSMNPVRPAIAVCDYGGSVRFSSF
uniref:E3 ubiquitin/ISG15 ligase TRIM25-like n=2 Tax=Myxine glutinosa TaxID=7769 RepID=UPI00358EF2EF